MTFKLIKTPTFVFPCEIQQIDEAGKTHTEKLRVRFNKIDRERWDALGKDSEDDRLLFDVLVNKIEDKLQGDDGAELAASDALASIRDDLSITGQIVDQGLEVMFGAAAKNARRSRRR